MKNILNSDIRKVRLIFLLLFFIIVLVSFLIVPKERSRSSTKKPIIIDYVFCTVENYDVYSKVLDNPSEGLARFNQTQKVTGNIREDMLNYKPSEETRKPLFTYKTVVRQRPYVKTRFDIIFRNIMIFGSLLGACYTSLLIYKTRNEKN